MIWFGKIIHISQWGGGGYFPCSNDFYTCRRYSLLATTTALCTYSMFPSQVNGEKRGLFRSIESKRRWSASPVKTTEGEEFTTRGRMQSAATHYKATAKTISLSFPPSILYLWRFHDDTKPQLSRRCNNT